MPDERPSRAVVFGKAVLGKDLHDGTHACIEKIPVRPAPALFVSQMVGNNQGLASANMILQLFNVVKVFERLVILGIVDAVITKIAGVPLVSQDRNELILLVGLGGHLLHAGPILLEHLEAIDPFHVGVVGHRRHVVPLRMRSEGEKVEVALSNIVGALEGSPRIADGIVVVEITPEELVIAAGGRALRFGRAGQQSSGGHALKPFTAGSGRRVRFHG